MREVDRRELGVRLAWVFFAPPRPSSPRRPPAAVGQGAAQHSGSQQLPFRPVTSPLHWGLLVSWVLIFVFACALRPVVSGSTMLCCPCHPPLKLAWYLPLS